MSYSETHNNLDPMLLRAEQSFFEKDEQEINQYEQRIKTDQEGYEQRIKTEQEEYEQQIKIQQHHNKEQENTIRLLKHQLLQAQEEIGISNDRCNKEQENTIRLLKHRLLQAQEEIHLSNDRFLQACQETKDFQLHVIQLSQAKEELSAALDSLKIIQEWQYIYRSSIISQVKLLIKTLARKLQNKAIWLIPLRGARKVKSFLKHFTPGKR